jgi:predicted ATP-grasp superfamily ATP-dependent carboligase
VNVLVTDVHYKNGLCAVRSLGRRGATVVAAAPRRLAAGAWSRFAAARIVYPAPAHDEEFFSIINRAVERHAIDVILPMSLELVEVFARNRSRLPDHVQIPIADLDKFVVAADKAAAVALAKAVAVPTPSVFAHPDDVDRFPVVVKPRHGSGVVRYANGAEELAEAFTPDSTIQQYIAGTGYGFSALFDHGVEKAFFMHKRVREYPVTGGASTAAESFYDERLRNQGLRLLRALGWHGVAMAEFKYDERDGEYKLIEINPKFWGSLDLPVAAGVDFPWLAARLALGHELPAMAEYELGLRFQWFFDDLLHLLARPSSVGPFARDLANRSVRSDLELRDLRPAAVDVVRLAGAVARRVWRRTLRRPHGAAKPRVDQSRIRRRLGNASAHQSE